MADAGGQIGSANSRNADADDITLRETNDILLLVVSVGHPLSSFQIILVSF